MDRIRCEVRRYAWGDLTAIPDLLGIPPDGQPQAELWMGAHPAAPALIGSDRLDDLIAARPAAMLGEEVAVSFGELPFLLKVLAAGQPLSIQAHPSLDQARAGFERENAAGIPLDAPDRTYRDANHKPELICALTRFEAKCGFRSLDETRAMLDEVDSSELDELRSRLAGPGRDGTLLAAAVSYLLHLQADDAGALVADVVRAANAVPAGSRFAEDWASVSVMNAAFPDDIGIVVGLLLNHVTLEPGQALFMPAGNLHAYLSGVGMELMANSDNVIRGGLTPKHIDVDELLRVLDCRPMDVPLQSSSEPVHQFDVPVAEFALARVELSSSVIVRVAGPAIVVLTSGNADFGTFGSVTKGQPVFVSADDDVVEVSGTGLAWIATVDAGQVDAASL